MDVARSRHSEFARSDYTIMNDIERLRLQLTRRTFLGRATTGIGTVALASLLNPGMLSAGATQSLAGDDRWRGVVSPLHFKPRAKRVIFLYMAGGPSHLETLDYKPQLAKRHGEKMPE